MKYTIWKACTLICQDTVVLGKNARHSFGRMRDRDPPPTQEKPAIAALRSKREVIWNLETKQELPPANDHWHANRRARIGLDLKLVRCEKGSIRGMWIEERERNERKKDVEGGRNRHEAFQRSSCSRNKTRWRPSLNVTKQLLIKERWREKKYSYFDRLLSRLICGNLVPTKVKSSSKFSPNLAVWKYDQVQPTNSEQGYFYKWPHAKRWDIR